MFDLDAFKQLPAPEARSTLAAKMNEVRDVLAFSVISNATGLSRTFISTLLTGEPVLRDHTAKVNTLAQWFAENAESLHIAQQDRDDQIQARAMRAAERKRRLTEKETMGLERALARSAGRYWQVGKYNLRNFTDADLAGLVRQAVAEVKRRQAERASNPGAVTPMGNGATSGD
jgi:hypothetical protein